MSVAGICELCERPGAEFACDRCAKLVCERHYDSGTGMCVECAGEVRGGRRGREDRDLPDGVDTYRS